MGYYDNYSFWDGDSQRLQTEDRELRKGWFSKALIILIVALNIVFTAVVLVLFSYTYSEPSTLIMAWFGFTTCELWALAFVKARKVSKSKEKQNTSSIDDEGLGSDLPGEMEEPQ